MKKIYDENRIWSRYSHDKVDIGEELAKVIRTLSKEFPLSKPLRALSVGSSAEPQFRILETAFRGGLYLFDLDMSALNVIKERIRRQRTDHVMTIQGDYNKIFLNPRHTEAFLSNKLGAVKAHLINFHHSLYYSRERDWRAIFDNLYKKILAAKGAIHAVLMASETEGENTTTWLYNHFAGKFFGCRNDQSLRRFSAELKNDPVFNNAQIRSTTHSVNFFVDDFEKFMKVIWMILLYPEVHRYSLSERKEIIGFIRKRFWAKKRPIIQAQDHLVIYKGIGFKGLI